MSKASNIINMFEVSELALDIVEDSYQDILPLISESEVDQVLNQYFNSINESKIKIPPGSRIVFGRVIKDSKVIGKIVKGKFVHIESNATDKDIESAPAHVRNIYKRLKADVDLIANDLSVSVNEVATAIANDPSGRILKKFGYSFSAIGKAVSKTFGLIDTSLRQACVELDKSGALNKLKSGTIKADKFLAEHPTIKKLAGPLVAGALYYQWNHMAFSGNFDNDFDTTDFVNAAVGDFSLEKLLASPEGVKSTIQFMAGLALGLTFPWPMAISSFKAAMVYTGAKKLKNSELAKKAMEKMIATMTGIPNGATVVFGKVILDGEQIGVIDNGKFVRESS